jgi:hypothetical protein
VFNFSSLDHNGLTFETMVMEEVKDRKVLKK